MSPGAPVASAPDLNARAARIQLFVFDVDGVLTDGGLHYGPDGESFKRFDVKDGHGIVMARLTGLPSAILTARRSQIVEVRARELGMVAVKQGQRDKLAGLKALLEELQVLPEHVAYMGDDVNDLGPLLHVGLASCPADAVPEVRAVAHYVSARPGGRGAARELIEVCLKVSSRWETALTLCNPGAILTELKD